MQACMMILFTNFTPWITIAILLAVSRSKTVHTQFVFWSYFESFFLIFFSEYFALIDSMTTRAQFAHSCLLRVMSYLTVMWYFHQITIWTIQKNSLLDKWMPMILYVDPWIYRNQSNLAFHDYCQYGYPILSWDFYQNDSWQIECCTMTDVSI